MVLTRIGRTWSWTAVAENIRGTSRTLIAAQRMEVNESSGPQNQHNEARTLLSGISLFSVFARTNTLLSTPQTFKQCGRSKGGWNMKCSIRRRRNGRKTSCSAKSLFTLAASWAEFFLQHIKVLLITAKALNVMTLSLKPHKSLNARKERESTLGSRKSSKWGSAFFMDASSLPSISIFPGKYICICAKSRWAGPR